jgi:hypothetical protein
VTKTVRANAVRSPLHTTRKADGKISSVIETYLDTIPKKFRPQYFNHIPVYITSGDAKGFLCNILNVTHVSAEAALKRPLDSGIILTVDHPSAVVGKLVENVPYEQVIQAGFVFPFLMIRFFHLHIIRTTLPLHLSLLHHLYGEDPWPPPTGTILNFNYHVDELAELGLNPDYLQNHRRHVFRLDYIHTASTFSKSEQPPPRERTPPPRQNIWHDLSFLDEHHGRLEGKWIMYSKKGAKRLGREVCVARLKENKSDPRSSEYDLYRIKGEKNLPAEDIKWELVHDGKMLVPFYGSEQNHDRLWVIIEGKEAGRYCKAVSCPKERENSPSPVKFRVALVDVKVVNGLLTTVVDAQREHIEVYPTHVAAIWQPEEVKKREPNVYVNARAGRDVTAAKRRAEKQDRESSKRSRKETEASGA